MSQDNDLPGAGDEAAGVLDALVVGAGFTGLYALHRLRDRMGLRARAVEAATDVGGTWYWNRYPGARCDIESIHYSYSFDEDLQREWSWSERYSGQPEILAYLEHVTERFDLRRDITFGTRVTAMTWDADRALWRVRTEPSDGGTADGAGREVLARFVVAGTGNVTVPKEPEFAGLDTFAGPVYATHRWPHTEPDLTGLRVGVVGTGASGIQVIPEVARRCGHLTVFQRTPNFATPLRNRPSDPAEVAETKARYPEVRERARGSFMGVPYPKAHPSALEASAEDRGRVYDESWATGGFRMLMSYADLLTSSEANETAAEYVRERIRERVDDPEVAALLCPDDHPLGTKRLPMETGYYETFNRENVTLVGVRDNPIREVTRDGLRLADGTHHELDVLVLATGFDAFTGALRRMNIVGRDGRTLNDDWAAGPVSYLGLMTHGFPNLFTITGPGAAVALYNNPLAIEDHVELATDAIGHALDRGCPVMEATAEAQASWRAELNARAHATLFPRAASWYMGANIPGKPRVVMMYVGPAAEYRASCAEMVADGWRGFTFDPAPEPVPAGAEGR